MLQELKAVHNALRHDLAVCEALAEQIAGGANTEYIQEQVQSLSTHGPLWKLRVNCLYYCRFVHTHHHIEDIALFPALRRASSVSGPVVDKLEADHRHIADLLAQISEGAKMLGGADSTAARSSLTSALQKLATDLLAHLAFEEEAIGPTLLEWEEWPL